jgi:8-oxo-dGTP pyrophosphatase MutT (NUDIX family)
MLTFLHSGDWAPGEVTAERSRDCRRRVPAVEAVIERTWAEALARPGAHLFDGPMCRLEEWSVSPEGRLRLLLSDTTYKVFYGTNMRHPELADAYGPEVLANPVGVSPALETADGFLLLGRRNASVAYYPNRIHPFAGALEPGDRYDLFAAARRELREELTLEGSDVSDVRCTGLVLEHALRQTEFIFRARCTLSRADVEGRLNPEEHRGIQAVPATPDGVADAARDPRLTPVAVASLLLWGRHAFGEEWFRRRAREIRQT